MACHVRARVSGSGEWSHDLSTVLLDQACEKRHRPWNLGLTKKTKEANHRKTAIVDLFQEAFSLLGFRFLLGELQRVV